jgi:DNA-directed RNA polymerase specialized sigma24 family protein
MEGVEAIEPVDRQLTRVQATPIDLDAAFASLRPRLLRIASSLVGALGEDAVQDTYIVARRSIGQLREPASIDAWLTRICAAPAARVG